MPASCIRELTAPDSWSTGGALYFENGLYDIRGRISAKNFHPASEREISFMKKNYVPKFDVKKLEEYLVRKESLPLGESS